MTTPRVLNGKEPHVRTSLERVCHSKEELPKNGQISLHFLASYLFGSLQILIITSILLGWSFISGHKKLRFSFQNQVIPMFFAIIANVAIAHLSLWARMIYESMTCFWDGARAAVCQTIGWQCYHLSSLCSSSQLDHYQSEFQDTWIPPSMSSYHPLSTPAFCSTFFTSLSLQQLFTKYLTSLILPPSDVQG